MLRPSPRLWCVMTPRVALRVLALDPATELTQATVKKAYIRQTLQCHPDLHPNDPDANEKFRTLSDALRVALTALQSRHLRGNAGPTQDVTASDVVCDPQAALEALRRAIVAYHVCKDTDGATTSATGAQGDASDPSHRDDAFTTVTGGDGAFFSPSLEHVSQVCHDEAVAMRRVHSFCTALPAVLCGAATAALFEAVAFFHVRYVQSTANCVLRFSKNLPVIVRRVVQQRKKHVYARHDRATAGLATGTRPHHQRIEDMAMKPLVLMGALVFDLPAQSRGAVAGKAALTGEVSCNIQGITQLADIRVTPALRCVIDPADSIGEIVAKLATWEAASFERLKLELAIVDVCRLLAGMLGLEETPTLAVMAHLAYSNDTVRCVLLTLQKLACDACLYMDDTAPSSASEEHSVEAGVRLAEGVLAEGAGTSESVEQPKDTVHGTSYGQQTQVPVLVAQCRTLAVWARKAMMGNIDLTWDDNTPLVRQTSEVRHSAVDVSACDDDTKSSADAATNDKTKPHTTRMRVMRHPSCSVAEEVRFAVSVPIGARLDDFLRELRRALATVVHEAAHARALLHDVLPLRDGIVREEFIRETGRNEDKELVEDEPRHRYRGPIQCFPRIYNMCTSDELKFWRRLHASREYVAKHAPAMSSVNLYYNCMPYRPHEHVAATTVVAASEAAGWVGEGEDGCDSAVITARELDDEVCFKTWLDGIIECCSLSREAQTILFKAGVGYVRRDDALPLTNFLSFVKLFVGATAVRAALERDCSATPGRVVQSQDIGLSIVVGDRCDVREGGKLFIPWYVDPSFLLRLLSKSDQSTALTI